MTIQSSKKWDAFISHASEEKDTIVRPLTNELIESGLRVWFDEHKLNVGDSLVTSHKMYFTPPFESCCYYSIIILNSINQVQNDKNPSIVDGDISVGYNK